MSRTKLYKQHGKWKNGEQKITPLLHRYFDRHNYKVGERAVLRNKRKEQIISNEMEDELNDITLPCRR